jgi:polysaccharide export outer membrane protein
VLKRLITIIVIANLLSGCIATTTNDTIEALPEITKTLTRYTREYVIFPGDMLEVTIYRNENLSRAVQVRGDGRISLPLLDEIYVERMTLSQLDDYVTSRLSERLVDPEVTIIVKNPVEPMVYVFGEVFSARPVPLRDARTAVQAVAHAGGMQMSGKLSEVSVVRLDENGHLVAITIEEDTSGQPGLYMALQNFPLQADDLIIVPESLRHQFVRRLNESVGAINQILTPYFQYRLLEEIIRRNDALIPQ